MTMRFTKFRTSVIVNVLAVMATIITLALIEAAFEVTIPGEIWTLLGAIAMLSKDMIQLDNDDETGTGK